MEFENHITHYFEREVGPFLSICDLDEAATASIIEREKDAETGFNRYFFGKDFFDYRKAADDLLIELYQKKFGNKAERRPYFAALGDADVVGGLYRDPYKIRIPLDYFRECELTFMCPDHFPLVRLSDTKVKRYFGYPLPKDYTEEKYPYFGKLLTIDELRAQSEALKIDRYLEENRRTNHWYRYVEAHIWADPQDMRKRFSDWIEVDPEPWTAANVSLLQNYKEIRKYNKRLKPPTSRGVGA
ncbi:hypothetical protein QEH56_10895 [Pelagicoccus enzymogenes]|uniref:hypothetical protein n=1 Tax=Pelagicoccus enzymogenes TaxID=2773457 RepID=UPI0028101893|nr:hypothetical protein [Pelagicoccus enzymogenes]MDQ8198660.1 hypothetical protein [Pelagicoccus enzymogenes]